MSQSVGSLHYDLDVDSTKLNKSLDGADSKVKQFGDNTSTAGQKMHDTLNRTAAGMAVVGAGLTLISKNALDFTVDLVKSSKALGQQLGVSTTEASRLVAAFGRMGIDADKASMSFGIFAKQIVKSTQGSEDQRLATEKLNIEIAKTQQAIGETTAEINKNGDSSGKLHLKLSELNNTLATQKNALNQSADAFAKLGVKTTDAAGKQKDFTTILFEVADKFKAMPNGIDKTALSMELFGRQGKDMIKVLNLGSDGIKALEAQADKLGLTLTAQNIGAVAKYIQSQKDLKESSDALKIAIGTEVAPVMAKFNGELNKVLVKFLETKGPVHDLTVGFLAFGGPVLTAGGAIVAFLANVSAAAPILSALAGPAGWVALAITAIALAAYLIVDHFGGLHQTIDAFKQKLEPIMPILKALGDYISSNFSSILDSLKETFKQLKDEMQPLLSFIQQHKTAFELLAGALAIIVALPVIAFFGTILAILGVLAVALNFLASNFQTIVTVIAVALFGALGVMVLVGALIVTHWQGIWNFVVSIFTAIANFFVSVWQAVYNTFTAYWGAIYGFVVGVLSSVFNFFVSIWGSILGFLLGVASWTWNAGVSIIRGLANGIRAVAGEVWNAVSNAASNIGNFFKGAASWLVATGWAIVQGLANGIRNAAGLVWSAIKAVAGDVTKIAKSILGIRSPSTVFAGIGRNITLGFVKGLDDTAHLAMSAMGRLGDNVISPSVNLAGAGATGVGTGTTVNHGSTTVTIGEINNRQDEAYVLRRMDRNTQLAMVGISEGK